MKSIFLLFLGSLLANVTTTQYVDDLERQLQLNRDTYLAGPHTAARQLAAIQYYDQWWAWLQSSDACGSRLLGAAGQSCIQDRTLNGKFPWQRYYRDPIINSRF